VTKPPSKRLPVPIQVIERKIHSIRDQHVMLDTDLAELYQVTVKALKQAVRRNPTRFPQDFMIELTLEEAAIPEYRAGTGSSRSQIVTLKQGMNTKYRPFAFTEQGVAMLSSVLKSPRSVRVNIAIMRAFVQMRQLAVTNKELLRKVNDMEAKYDSQFRDVFVAIKRLMEPPKARIGFPIPIGTPRTKG
jgi:hypothetical protein